MKRYRLLYIIPFILLIFLFSRCNGLNGFSVFTSNETPPPAPEENIPIIPEYHWKYAAPKEHKMDSAAFTRMESYISSFHNGLHSVLVVKDADIVYENYYNGWDADKMNNIKSATKSVSSALIGLLIDQQRLSGTEEKTSSLFPEYFEDKSDKRGDITLKNILTMTSGLEWNNDESDIKAEWWENADPVGYALTMSPLNHQPGTVFNYNSSLSHMLSYIVKRKSNMETIDFARKYLFNPIGIINVRWETDMGGVERGNSELYLKTRDMAKIGWLYLNKGNWFGSQVISGQWVNDSFKKAAYDQYGNKYYGYQWWIKKVNGEDVYFANGYGGQYIFIIPSENTVVVTTCEWDNTASTKIPLTLLSEYILPAIN